MLRQFSRTQRWLAFALLLMLGLMLFASLHVDLWNASIQWEEAITGGENEENEAATIAEYFQYRFNQMKDKSGKIPDGALIGALNARQAMVAKQKNSTTGGVAPLAAGIDNTSWTFAGPGNVGGRIRAILPINASTVFIGSVSGGIWKTTNCCSTSTTWTPVDDWMANLAISSLIVDPTNANVMYAGTGEGFGNADGIRGAGVFKSTDSGTTWSQLASTNSSAWYFVNRLAISPDGATLLAATNTTLFRSTDSGGSWQAKLSGTFQDVKFDPSNSANAIATAKDVAYYSTDGGATWTAATGLPTAGRKELAYAPSNPATVYVSMEDGSIYKSTNGGQSYAQANANAGHQSGGQGWYDNAIWVNPTNPNNLAVAGLDIYQSTDGGTSFTKISDWTQSWPGAASPHADHHALVSLPGSNTALLNGNDGGLYYTADMTTVGNDPTYTNGWVNLNNNLGLTQFFGVAGNSNGVLYGGAQDNGVVRGTAANSNAWTYANGGDGGKSAADPTNANYFYNEYIYGKVNRSSDGGGTSQDIFGSYFDGTNWTCRPAPYRIDDACNSQGSFIAPILLDPNNAQRLLVGDLSLWVTNDARTPDVSTSATGVQWAAIKASTGSGITAIAVAPSDSNVIWVGYEDGRIDMTTNGTNATPTWTQVDTNIGTNNPGTGVGAIAIDKNNSSIVYVGFWGFGPHRVWRTADGGATWTSITSNLPDAPVYAVAINPANSAWLYIGTEIGVFASENTGASWNVPTGTGKNGDGPANVPVFDLQWVNGGNSTGTATLIAGTHGRGAWTANTTPITTGTIIIRKTTSPAGGTGFGFTSNIPGAASFTLNDGQNQTLSNVTAGSYTVSENAPSGYSLTNLVCTDPTSNSTVNVGTRTATINLAAGETVDCTFTNTQNAPTTGTIIIRKTTSPAGGTGFGFTSNIAGATSFTLNDGQNKTISNVTSGSYTVSENAPSGYSLTNLVCTDPSNNSTGNVGTRTATINLAAGETVDCTFTNTQNAPTTGTIIIRKTTSPAGGTGFGFTSNIAGATSFTLNDGQNKTISNVTAGSYTVSENAPSGYSLTNLVCTDPSNNSTGNVGTRTATINLAAGETVDCTFTNTQTGGSTPPIVISSDSNGSVPGLSYRDEDIIAYDPGTGVWRMVFDGSDVGLGDVDVDGFAFLPNGHLLLSVDKDFNLRGFGAVDEADILEFIPTSYGPNTRGSYAMYFDGSDVGLNGSDEDVDAIDFDASGNLVISVAGAFKAQNVTGNDEDLFVLNGFTAGPNTQGTWALYFDGSDVGLSSSSEDIFGLWADHANSKLYLTTHGDFSVPGAKGDHDDILVCRYTSLGATTACTFSIFWNGDNVGFGNAIDGLSIGAPPTLVSAADSSDSAPIDDTVEYVGDDANEPDPLDGEETTDEATQNYRILLPLITQ